MSSAASSAVPYTNAFESPYKPANAGQISADGHSALLRFEIAGDEDQAADRVGATLKATAAAQAANPDFTVEQVGDASINKQLNDSINKDFSRAFVTSLPITLVILLIAFGALVAASLPILLALTAVLATIGLVAVTSHFSPVDSSINEVILLIGLAVGVDYSMFYLRREREERESGRSAEASLAAAAATSGRAVLVSGLTVMVAMAGMYLGGASTFTSFATGTIIVVAVAVVGSLTVLPALLAWLGDRVEKGGVPIIKNRRWNAGESGIWARILTPVLRHPLVSAIAAAGLLIVLAIPAFSIHTATPGTDSLPQNLSVVKTYNKVQKVFPGGPIPAVVAVSAANVTSPQVSRAIADLRKQAAANPLFKQPVTTNVNPDRTVAEVDIPLAGDGSDSKSSAALAELRDHLVPATIGRVPSATADVGGFTAGSQDFNDTMKSHLPLVFALRPDRGLPAAADHLPLDRDPDQGDRAQPALGRGRLRGAGVDLPGRPSAVAPGLPLQRRDRPVDAAIPVRGPVRTLDGLPRVHPHADPRGVRPRTDNRGGGHTRDQDHRRRRDQRRRRDDLGLRDLRHPVAADLQAAGRGAGGCGSHRRDDHPRRAAAGDDEAPRRLELVPAEVARVAAASDAGGSCSRARGSAPRRRPRAARARRHLALRHKT